MSEHWEFSKVDISDLQGPLELSLEYLRAVERVENLPSSQDSSEKSWASKAEQGYRDHYPKAVRLH